MGGDPTLGGDPTWRCSAVATRNCTRVTRRRFWRRGLIKRQVDGRDANTGARHCFRPSPRQDPESGGAHSGGFWPDFGNKQRLVFVTKAGGSSIVSSHSPDGGDKGLGLTHQGSHFPISHLSHSSLWQRMTERPSS